MTFSRYRSSVARPTLAPSVICPPNRVRLHRHVPGPTDMHTALAQLPRRARMPARAVPTVTNDVRAQWEKWARKRYNDPQQVRAAVEAAMRHRGGSKADAATAAIKAATSVGIGAPPAGHAPVGDDSQSQAASGTANVASEFHWPAPPGTIVGYARRVQRQQQLSGGGAIQSVEF